MMETALNCGANGWLMIAGGVVTYGVLALAGAALIKYLFFADRGSAAVTGGVNPRKSGGGGAPPIDLGGPSVAGW